MTVCSSTVVSVHLWVGPAGSRQVAASVVLQYINVDTALRARRTVCVSVVSIWSARRAYHGAFPSRCLEYCRRLRMVALPNMRREEGGT